MADTAFAAGAPLDEVAESATVLGGSSRCAGLSFSGYGNGFHAEVVQRLVDGGLAALAAERATGPADERALRFTELSLVRDSGAVPNLDFYAAGADRIAVLTAVFDLGLFRVFESPLSPVLTRPRRAGNDHHHRAHPA
jgi:hypothetical protein